MKYFWDDSVDVGKKFWTMLNSYVCYYFSYSVIFVVFSWSFVVLVLFVDLVYICLWCSFQFLLVCKKFAPLHFSKLISMNYAKNFANYAFLLWFCTCVCLLSRLIWAQVVKLWLKSLAGLLIENLWMSCITMWVGVLGMQWN